MRGRMRPQSASISLSIHVAAVIALLLVNAAVSHQARVLNEIDRFVFARLEKEGLAPQAEADRHTLARRLSLDLTGLPPTWEQVQAFVKDTSPNAYEKLVDRLLASPHYGERLTAYWLDMVRFADTRGYHGDQ